MQGGEGFQVAASWLGSKLKVVRKDFTQIEESFDIVLFLGILYHQRNPLDALKHLSRLTRECAVVETHYLKDESRPILRFYPGSSLNSDPTNYWGRNYSGRHHLDATNKMILYPLPHKSIEKKFFLLDSD